MPNAGTNWWAIVLEPWIILFTDTFLVHLLLIPEDEEKIRRGMRAGRDKGAGLTGVKNIPKSRRADCTNTKLKVNCRLRPCTFQ